MGTFDEKGTYTGRQITDRNITTSFEEAIDG
ncbi:MAG: hypothetical protein RL487_1376, partial [Actinomycetota bacterium]